MNSAGPVRSLQIVDTLGMGGAETWLMETLRRWSRTGEAKMDFLLTSGNEGIFDAEARSLGALTHYVRYGRGSLTSFAGKFKRLLREGRYDAVHDHQDYTSGWHFFLGGASLPKIRVTHVHNPSYQIRNNYGVTPARRLTACIGRALVRRCATHIAGTSRQVISEYGFDAPAFSAVRKAALHCGFDTARFQGDKREAKNRLCREFGWPENARIVLFAGRIDRSPDPADLQNHKNSAFAVTVAIELASRDTGARVLFAGAESPAVEALKRRIAEAGFADRIVFAGIRTDIETLMRAADTLFFPSRGEGLGMVAVEAQAAGLPVLASTAVPRECMVVPELMRFEPLDAGPAHWAEALAETMARPPQAADANRRVASSPFSIENSSRALLKLYREGVLP